MPLHSISLSSGRAVTVFVPARLEARPRRSAVLILHDGQNLFDPNRAFVPGQHWRVAETVEALMAERAIRPLVVCGVDHGGERRLRELTPTRGPAKTGGGGRRYLQIIVDELLPRLRREFPVASDRAGTGLGGSSLGGLITLSAAVEYPDVFGRFLVMSPSVWWDRRVILRQLARRPRALTGARMWLDIGLEEGEKAVDDARRLAQSLSQASSSIARPARLDLRYLEDVHGDHSERSWARRLPDALRFLYGEKTAGVFLRKT